MGKFDEYVLQNLQKEDTSFESSQEIKEELERNQKMLSELDVKTQEDQKTILTNQVNTTIGFLNQLIIRIQHPYLREMITAISEQQKKFIEQLDATRNIQDEKTLLQTLGSLEKTVSDYYAQAKENMLIAVQKGMDTLTQREAILKEVEGMVSKMNAYSSNVTSKEQTEMLQTLAGLYGKAMQEDISTLQGLESEVTLLKEWKENATPIIEALGQQTTTAPNIAQEQEKIFPLFAKINDQIIGYHAISEQDKTYVKYLLEDGSYYFAVAPYKENIDALYQQFEQSSSLSHDQNKEAWEKNLETILFCLQVYYQTNEWVRYEEISNKGKMTKEKDAEIAQYKKILSFMEDSVLKPYLAYADTLSKQVLIGENSVETLYPNAASETDTKKTSQKLILDILGNKDAPKEVTSEQILKTLYSLDQKNILDKIDQQVQKQEEKKEAPVLAIPSIPSPGENKDAVLTNYDEMNRYLEQRKTSFGQNYPEDTSAAITKRQDTSLYKDINQYLDLEEAREITNHVYQAQNPGQGDYAKFAYLQEGKVEGFTSKYQARQIATMVDRNQYFYFMLEQAMKDYATFNEQKKENTHFGEGKENMFSLVGQTVLEEPFDGKHLVTQIISDDYMLDALSKNFDGRYLIPEKGSNPLFDKVLEDYERGNPMFAAKVKTALESLKEQFKTPNYQVPTKSALALANQAIGKVA